MTNKGDRQVDRPRAREGKPNTVVEKAGFCFCFFVVAVKQTKNSRVLWDFSVLPSCVLRLLLCETSCLETSVS